MWFNNGGNHAISAHAYVAISAADLDTLGVTGSYMLSYFCTLDFDADTDDNNNNRILVSASAILV